MAKTLAMFKTLSKYDWKDSVVVMGEEECEGFKILYLYYKDQTGIRESKVPAPVDVDFDIELVRTNRINVVYILNLLKKVQEDRKVKSEEEKQHDVDLILREIECYENESLQLKKDVIKHFILTWFYDLPDDSDIIEAFTQFEKEQLQVDMEEFDYDNQIDYVIISDLFSSCVFSKAIPDEEICKRLTAYKLGLLKITKLRRAIKLFVQETYQKYKAEGE